MASARPVRISRRAAPTRTTGAAPETGASPGRVNAAGMTRSKRLFALFLLTIGGSYLVFVALLATSPARNAPSYAASLGLLTVFAGAILVVGFALTLGRTPRAVETGPERLVVVEFLGTRRIYPLDGSYRRTVENRYPEGWLAPAPTEMVAVASARRPTRHYLVGEGLLPEARGA